LYTLRQKTVIPHYSLQETSIDGNALFEIKEVDGASIRRSNHLFLPHRKDYYFFFLVKKGSNRHWIDFVSHEVNPGNLYFTLPHQVHLKEKNAPVDGTLLAFTEEFLLLQEQSDWKKLPILQNPDDRHELKLSGEDISFLNSLFTQMLTEFRQEQDWRKGMLQSYLKIFLVCLSRIYTRQGGSVPVSSGSQLLVRRMKELVNEKYDSLHQVSDYARLLNVTPGHLNDTIREQTGRTATSMIQERVILEAKRALFHADLSVKEIAYSLGFDDAAYFNRFFKRLTNETPTGFRTAIRENHH
jgi:AraC family transcriptional activator of pobA